MPVVAVSPGGRSYVSSGSITATVGSISGLRRLTFTLCSGDASTALRVTSAPVPAVVGSAAKGAERCAKALPRPIIST